MRKKGGRMKERSKRQARVKEALKKVKLLILDVDGVLTGGEIIYDSCGRELKIFNVKDGLGIFLLGKVGIKTILLTARKSEVLEKRAKDMNVEEVIGGIVPKESAFAAIKKKYHIESHQACFIGDDLIDIELMKQVGVGVAVSDAPGAVKKHAHYITTKKGGEGAVREVTDLIIGVKKLEHLVWRFLKNPE